MGDQRAGERRQSGAGQWGVARDIANRLAPPHGTIQTLYAPRFGGLVDGLHCVSYLLVLVQ